MWRRRNTIGSRTTVIPIKRLNLSPDGLMGMLPDGSTAEALTTRTPSGVCQRYAIQEVCPVGEILQVNEV